MFFINSCSQLIEIEVIFRKLTEYNLVFINSSWCCLMQFLCKSSPLAFKVIYVARLINLSSVLKTYSVSKLPAFIKLISLYQMGNAKNFEVNFISGFFTCSLSLNSDFSAEGRARWSDALAARRRWRLRPPRFRWRLRPPRCTLLDGLRGDVVQGWSVPPVDRRARRSLHGLQGLVRPLAATALAQHIQGVYILNFNLRRNTKPHFSTVLQYFNVCTTFV